MYQMYAADPRARINLGIRRRLAPLLENDSARIKLMNSLLLSMPGSPILYYGDEIGMGDNIYLGDRDGVRTPMQWRPERNAGFSRADPQRLYLPPIMDPIYGYEAVNVEAQSARAVVAAQLDAPDARRAQGRSARSAAARSRFSSPATARSSPTCASTATRSSCASPTSRARRSRSSSISRASRGACPSSSWGARAFPPIGDLPYLLTLAGHGFLWFRLAAGADVPAWHEERIAARRAAGAGAVRRLGEPVPRSRRAVAHRAGGKGARPARARGAAGVRRGRAAGMRQRASRCGASRSPITSSGSAAGRTWLVTLAAGRARDGRGRRPISCR